MSSRIQELIELCMQEKASEAERNELLRLMQGVGNEEEAKRVIGAVLKGERGHELVGDGDGSGDAGHGDVVRGGRSGGVVEMGDVMGRDGEMESGLTREGGERIEGHGEVVRDGRSEGVVGMGDVENEEQDVEMSEGVSAAILEAIFQSEQMEPESMISGDGVGGKWGDDIGGKSAEGVGGKGGERRVGVIGLRWGAYAAILLLVIVGVVLFSARKGKGVVSMPVGVVRAQELLPGGNKAILTLASGATVNLDDAKNGDIAKDGNAQIVKAGSGGVLVYHALEGEAMAASYNTITTPRGGKYQLDLADGSKVWLNASSSVRFPTVFSGKERRVELTGEGYFEIASRANMPFVVTANGVTIQVIGTHFNINAYKDESAIRTTLIEGAVRVSMGKQAVLLRPGKQAVAQDGGDGLKEVEADAEEVMAWKNGLFNFKNLDIETIMRQISRWYDVEVVYEGKKPEGHFSGMISRNTPALTVLKMLEYGGVHFRIEGKRVVILP